MMYQIKCDGLPLLDLRDEDLIVGSPKINLEVNTTGEGSFYIYDNHPHYGRLKKLKSVFEVSDEIGVIFRGRMTNDSRDFDKCKFVDLEGAMSYFNDSKVRPYSFPEDWLADDGYIAASASGNVIEFFLAWLINQHNAQVDEFQRFKLGRVTVTDPNNYLSRSDTKYPSTWDVLKSKLFDSALGGYLCIRYEDDGNYIDYLSSFDLTNTQEIVFGENLLDLKTETDATETYTAVIPVGATIESESTDEDGNTEMIKTVVNIASLPDGDITNDIIKAGDMIYSRSAREAHGLIIAPVDKTTWDDVTDANNLLNKSVVFLQTGMMFSENIEVTAVDLHFTDDEIQSFRIYRNVNVRSDQHGHSGTYQLPKLSIDLLNPQNTKITVGSTRRTMTDINGDKESDTIQRIESAEKDISDNKEEVTTVKNQMLTNSTQITNDCRDIILKALESYVESSAYEDFKNTLESELRIWASGITGRVSATEETIANVDGELQRTINEITKYFTFDINGLTIGQVDNPNKVVIDNDEISILVNGVVVQRFDANGRALIPELTITGLLNLLGLLIEEDDTHINCDYIGGVA